ncbi:xylulokinase [Microbacterium sp.]|uniref:xylulokinase n=1 Tax=Microbacterium sp. TaxID=51671 RepID=UPI0037CBEC32
MSVTAIAQGHTALGIELGSTRIKACLVDLDDPASVLATGSHQWANELVDGHWTYALGDAWAGVQAAFAELSADAEIRHGVRPLRIARMGVSAMMHGYLAFDADGELLVPFRTWRDTHTTAAAAELSELFGTNIPLRWSIAHLRQAMLDGEEHVPRIQSLTTLAGYVHRSLTGRDVLGVGEASGMFPIDPATGDFDAAALARFDDLAPGFALRAKLPAVLPAGADAGALTPEGARLIDPDGQLQAGARLCPPEGDAGTGMVATNAVAPRTGNISVGTSVFAMVVLDSPIPNTSAEIDVVCTPAGDPVAMVHCNNGASELGEWAGVFARFAEASGHPTSADAVFRTLLDEAVRGDPDAGGILAFNQLSGEPVLDLSRGHPMIIRHPAGELTLANLMQAQLYGVFAAVALGLEILTAQGVRLDRLSAHGGLFRTARVAQQQLASMLDVPVSVGALAAEGGAWGMAVLAAYDAHIADLRSFLEGGVFREGSSVTVAPEPERTAGFQRYLERYRSALVVARVAEDAL